jgi:TolA-binding protein
MMISGKQAGAGRRARRISTPMPPASPRVETRAWLPLSACFAAVALLGLSACAAVATGPQSAATDAPPLQSSDVDRAVWGADADGSAPTAPARASYNDALELLESGDYAGFRDAMWQLSQDNPTFEPASRLARVLDAPLALARTIAEQRMEDFMARPATLRPFDRPAPTVPDSPPSPVLTKDEFETTLTFQARVRQAQEDYEAEVQSLRDAYLAEAEEYNAAIDAYNESVRAEMANREERSDEMFWRFVDEAVDQVLGRPQLRNAYYNADVEAFTAELVGSGGSEFIQNVSIQVPLEEARGFVEAIDRARPALFFEPEGAAGLRVTRIVVELDDSEYAAKLADRVGLPVTVQRTLQEPEVLAETPLNQPLQSVEYELPF